MALLRDGFGWSAAEIAPVFERWNAGPLRSYLVEITAEVLRTVDPEPGKALVDVIVDSAGQKGTGRWSAIEALHLAAPASAIEAAVAARTLSSRREEREAGALQFGGAKAVAAQPDLEALEAALLAGKIACYAQGSASSRRLRPSSGGTCRSPRSHGSGGQAASSARQCSTRWRRRSRRHRR